MPSSPELPNVAAILGPVLARVSVEERPLLIALAERFAAERYRDWARLSEDPARRAELAACAEREEEIARRVESLFAQAESVQRELLAKHPDLQELNRSLFAERPLEEQYAIQASGERVGAETWRSLARRAKSEHERELLSSCAELEEQSAVVLESLLASDSELAERAARRRPEADR